MELSLLKPARTRTRLWQGGVALAIYILTLAIGNNFISSEKAVNTDMLGMDFLPFYAGGAFARTGRTDLLYDIPAIKAFEQTTATANNIDLGDHVGPFWNPPFYAWVFAPLSMLPYRQALAVWTLMNVVALAGSIVLLVRMLPIESSWRSWALVPLLMLVSMPFVQAISHGQNTFMSLLLLCATVTAWRNRQAVWAGVFCGLLFYKPQHAALMAMVMTLSLGRRTLLGLGGVLASLVIITDLTMPGALVNWITQLPANIHYMQVEHTYNWERHATLKAFWRMLLQGRDAGEETPLVATLTIMSTALVGMGLLSALLRTRKPIIDNCWTGETNAIRLDRLIAATVAATPLIMPFYFDYDLLLIAVPAVLFAGEMLMQNPGCERRTADRWLVRTWGLMFVVTMINSPIARLIHVGAIAPVLCVVAALLIIRSRRQPAHDPSPVKVAEEIGVMLQYRRAA